MRLSHLTVIFAIIFLPIILITSYYIQRQVDTINTQLDYDSKLLDATYDALSAFEINTANENLSMVADSLRSIIEASNNIFFNTLATNMGVSNASKSYVQPYVPAVLYTLYDGYYIYAPTSNPTVCTDKYGQTISVGDYGVIFQRTISSGGKSIGIYSFDETKRTYPRDAATGELNSTQADGGEKSDYTDLPSEAKSEYGQLLYKNVDGTYSTVLHSSGDPVTEYRLSYILKSFTSYSANYVRSNLNIDVNYTLDNFIAITGTIDDVYYNKSGYLIKKGLVRNVEVNGENVTWYRYSEEEIDDLIAHPDSNVIRVTLDNGDGITTVISTDENIPPAFSGIDYEGGGTVNQDCLDAVKYYVKAWMFSSWVEEKLSDLTEGDIVQSAYISAGGTDADIIGNSGTGTGLSSSVGGELIYNFAGSTKKIFDYADPNFDPENYDSNFHEHRFNVIKNSINYNLALAVVTYTELSSIDIEYKLPMLSDIDWNTILQNVSMVTFMQGLRCGLKYYNNYAIATSTNNELTVTPDEIYYVPVEQEATVSSTGKQIWTDIENSNYGGVDLIETAHRIDCLDLKNTDYYVSFKSKEVKYDKIWDDDKGFYVYDHQVYLDYNCIVDDNYITQFSTGERVRGNYELVNTLKKMGGSRLKAYRIAVGKERNNLYKSIDFGNNYGYKSIIYNSPSLTSVYSVANTGTTMNLSRVYKVEVTISGTTTDSAGVYSDRMRLRIHGETVGQERDIAGVTTRGVDISTVSGNVVSTVEFKVNSTIIAVDDQYNIDFEGGYGTKTRLLAIKIFYK